MQVHLSAPHFALEGGKRREFFALSLAAKDETHQLRETMGRWHIWVSQTALILAQFNGGQRKGVPPAAQLAGDCGAHLLAGHLNHLVELDDTPRLHADDGGTIGCVVGCQRVDGPASGD